MSGGDPDFRTHHALNGDEVTASKRTRDVLEVRVGDALRAALRAYQEAIGAPPDGYPTLALLRKMRGRG